MQNVQVTLRSDVAQAGAFAYMQRMCAKRNQAAHGPSHRQLRVAELIRRRLSEVLARGEVHDPALNRLSITVAEVRCSTDLRHATAFVMPLGGEGQAEALDLLRRNRVELRRMVGRSLTLKFAPELRFQLDETFDQMDATRRLLQDATVQRDIAAPDTDDADRDDADTDDDPDGDSDDGARDRDPPAPRG